MEYVTGVVKKEVLELEQLLEEGRIGSEVKINGAVHSIRDMGEVAFIILRKKDCLIQTVYEEGAVDVALSDIHENDTMEAMGVLSKEDRAPNGIEIRLKSVKILSRANAPMPIPVNRWKLSSNPETILDLRPVSLRNVKERAKFKIQEGIVRGFRDYLHSQGFTEIHTPKIVAKGAEGGANIFKLDYFNKKAELAQSPQFYKQTMVGVFDRVFEVAPVFRAEKHNTPRHLNEYTSMDFEMGYIDSFEDIMGMEAGILKYTMELLEKEYAKELALLKVEMPKTDKIPQVRFHEAKKLVSEKYNRQMRNPNDLEPEEEKLISRYFKEEEGADFVFVTHYPSKKRPFYAMDDPTDPSVTLSFDLLFRGIEVTTGGQRIHDLDMLKEKMDSREMTGEGMESYLLIFKHGMPPHGGLGLGLERLTMKLLGLDNVRETTLFPRDLSRLEP